MLVRPNASGVNVLPRLLEHETWGVHYQEFYADEYSKTRNLGRDMLSGRVNARISCWSEENITIHIDKKGSRVSSSNAIIVRRNVFWNKV